MKLLILSPHFDDGVLSCTSVLRTHPGAVVTTVFGGSPGPVPLTPWDGICGFVEGDDVVAARRQEDAHALAAVDATQLVLDFLDFQYRHDDPTSGIATALSKLFDQAEAVMVPMGIAHPDHQLLREIALGELAQRPELDSYIYADLPYAHCPPMADLVTEAMGHVLAATSRLEPSELEVDPDFAFKQSVLDYYPSQLRGLPSMGFTIPAQYEHEQFWRVRFSS